MTSLGKYLLGVLSCGLICGIAMEIISIKSANGAILQMMCGVVMMLCVVSPLLDIRLGSMADFAQGIRQDADSITAEGENLAQDYYRSVITQRTNAYILDKAVSLGADIEAEVSLAEDDSAVPRSVTIRGRISPYAKGLLSTWMESELGIESEEQTWIASN